MYLLLKHRDRIHGLLSSLRIDGLYMEPERSQAGSYRIDTSPFLPLNVASGPTKMHQNMVERLSLQRLSKKQNGEEEMRLHLRSEKKLWVSKN